MSDDQQAEWWQKTEVLTGISLVALLFIVLLPLIVTDERLAFGVPLGYFLAVIIVPVTMFAAIFAIGRGQERLDQQHRGLSD